MCNSSVSWLCLCLAPLYVDKEPIKGTCDQYFKRWWFRWVLKHFSFIEIRYVMVKDSFIAKSSLRTMQRAVNASTSTFILSDCLSQPCTSFEHLKKQQCFRTSAHHFHIGEEFFFCISSFVLFSTVLSALLIRLQWIERPEKWKLSNIRIQFCQLGFSFIIFFEINWDFVRNRGKKIVVYSMFL